MFAELLDSIMGTGRIRDYMHIGLAINDRRDAFPQQRMIVHA
jgi:hypothetical protein